MTYRKTQCWVCKGIGHSQFGYPCDWCHGSGWVIEHYRHRTVRQWLGDLYVAIINFLDHIDTED
jgi:DnaJ-class molecular chaperone